MKAFASLKALCFFTVLSMNAACATNGSDSTASVDAAGIVLATQQALAAVAVSDKMPADLRVSSVKLTLSGLVQEAVGGGFKLLIFEAGADKTYESTTTLELELAEPESEVVKVSNASAQLGESVARSVVDSVVSLANSVGDSQSADFPLVTKKATSEVKFVVIQEGNAGFKLEVPNVGFELGGDVKSSSTQTLRIELSRK